MCAGGPIQSGRAANEEIWNNHRENGTTPEHKSAVPAMLAASGATTLKGLTSAAIREAVRRQYPKRIWDEIQRRGARRKEMDGTIDSMLHLNASLLAKDMWDYARGSRQSMLDTGR